MNIKFFLFFLLTLAGCSDVQRPIPKLDSDAWTISGRVIDQKTGKGLSDQRIDLIRVQSDCLFCKPDTVRMVSFRADGLGRFEISSQVPGVYELVAKSRDNAACIAHRTLGELKSQNLDIKLIMKSGKCYFEM